MINKSIIISSMLICIAFVSMSYAQSDVELCEIAYNAEKFSEAYPMCLKAAEAGDALAQKNVGHMLANGRGIPIDEEKAAVWYTKSAAQGNARAQANLAIMYQQGHGVAKNENEAARLFQLAIDGFRKSAERGDKEAQFSLGRIYDYSEGVFKDTVQGFYWLKKAADQGVPDAQSIIGEKYESGDGVTPNADEAKKYYLLAFEGFRDAAEKGSATKQYVLGLMYLHHGKAVSKDDKDAQIWFRKSAEQGIVEAQLELGKLYEEGQLIKQDYNEAIKWYRKAAEQGHVEAQAKLGSMYDVWGEKEGITANPTESAKWYLKAAEQGDVHSAFRIGWSYRDGNGVPKDSNEAIKWFKKAAEQGDVMATTFLAAMYFNGIGIIQDYTEASVWYRKAAEYGATDAIKTLGDMYYDGLGVKQDYFEAVNWYKKAAIKGDSGAQVMLGRAYYLGRGVEKDYKNSFKWYFQAATNILPEPEALIAVGDMYYDGEGVVKDYSEAMKWYLAAANQDSAEADRKIGGLWFEGKGIPKNYAVALTWFKRAAYKDDAGAQLMLGGFYADGLGVDKDPIQSLAWYTLASSKKDIYQKVRDEAEEIINAQDVEKAQQLAIKLRKEIGQTKNQQVVAKAPLSSDKLKHLPLTIHTFTNSSFTPNDIAIIIGIEKYRTVPSTDYANADAGMVRDYLKALGIPERNIEFLADDRATLSDIRKVIETKLPNMVKTNSRVILYYAGHGAPGSARGESYLVPYDGDPSFLADTAYPLSRLYDRLSRLKAKEILVVLDSCFSGAGGRSVLAKGTRPLVMIKDTPLPSSNKMIVLTSSRGSQITTSLPEVGHGAFTYFFLRALQEGNRDIGEVYAYLKDRVTEEAKRQNVDQTPTISPDSAKLKGRFVFTK